MIRSILFLIAITIVSSVSGQAGKTTPSGPKRYPCCRVDVAQPSRTATGVDNAVIIKWDNAFATAPASDMAIDIANVKGGALSGWSIVDVNGVPTIDATKLAAGDYTVTLTSGGKTARRNFKFTR